MRTIQPTTVMSYPSGVLISWCTAFQRKPQAEPLRSIWRYSKSGLPGGVTEGEGTAKGKGGEGMPGLRKVQAVPMRMIQAMLRSLAWMERVRSCISLPIPC